MVGVVVGVMGAHGVVFDADQTVFEIPSALGSVDVGHVAVVVVAVNTRLRVVG